MDRVSFTVPGAPVGKARPRFTKQGFVFTQKKTAGWEQLCKLAASDAMKGRPPMECPVFVNIVATLPVPQSWSKKKRAAALAGELLPTVKPDADNLCKAALDACNGIVYADDKQAVEVRIVKRYGSIPGTSVSVIAAGPIARAVEFIPTEEAA